MDREKIDLLVCEINKLSETEKTMIGVYLNLTQNVFSNILNEIKEIKKGIIIMEEKQNGKKRKKDEI